MFRSFELHSLTPSKKVFFIGEYSLGRIVQFKKRIWFVCNFIMKIDSYFEHFCNISNCVNDFDFHESSLVYIVVNKFRKFRQLYLFFVIKSETVVFVEDATVKTVIVRKWLIVIFLVTKKTQN